MVKNKNNMMVLLGLVLLLLLIVFLHQRQKQYEGLYLSPSKVRKLEQRYIDAIKNNDNDELSNVYRDTIEFLNDYYDKVDKLSSTDEQMEAIGNVSQDLRNIYDEALKNEVKNEVKNEQQCSNYSFPTRRIELRSYMKKLKNNYKVAKKDNEVEEMINVLNESKCFIKYMVSDFQGGKKMSKKGKERLTKMIPKIDNQIKLLQPL